MSIYESPRKVFFKDFATCRIKVWLRYWKFLCILETLYEFLTNLAIPLQTSCRISCKCYKYLKMPLQTLRMQNACLPILLLFHLFAIRWYYFVFKWIRQVSLACSSAEERGKGKTDHSSYHKLISSFKSLQTKRTFYEGYANLWNVVLA